MLLAPGIFPKFWSIPSLISPSAPTITGSVSVLIPPILVVLISRSLYFENFSMNFVEVFWLDGTDMSICLQHHLAWSLYYYPQTFWPGLLILAQILLFLVWNLKVIDTSHSYSWANFRFLSTPPPPPPPTMKSIVQTQENILLFILVIKPLEYMTFSQEKTETFVTFI